MATMHSGRYTAEIEGDFVVFLIGMRLNRPWKVHQWLPVFTGMRRMLRELARHPEQGLLGAHTGLLFGGPAVVQYRRSFEHLERFARDPGNLHLPAWRWFNRAVKASGDVGIWHGPIARRGQSAARRIGARVTDDLAVPVYPNP
jgi:hypothetical protein